MYLESGEYSFTVDRASVDDVIVHLVACASSFVPPLDSRVDIMSYATKIREKAVTFECWYMAELVGLTAVYMSKSQMYITSVSVFCSHGRRGIASRLIRSCIEHATRTDMDRVLLEVDGDNYNAIKLYHTMGFRQCGPILPDVHKSILMELHL